MAGKGVFKSTLLCIGLLTIYMAGCGAAAENAGTEETIREEESPISGDAAEAGDAIAEKTDGAKTSADEEQADMEPLEEEITFEGLTLSILGDSVSTYEGYIPDEFSVFYPTYGKVTDVSQTWWMRLLDDTGMELCSNNSSSGSTCVGDSLCIDNPKYGCSGYRISSLTGERGKMPDVVIVYMGTNDLLIGAPLGDNDGTKLVEEGMIENFSDAYCLILDKISSDYPAAKIYCCTLPAVGDWGTEEPFVVYTNNIGLTGEDYSKRIQTIAKNKGISLIDLFHCGIKIDNLAEMTSDGVHFTPAGMECVEQAILNGIK